MFNIHKKIEDDEIEEIEDDVRCVCSCTLDIYLARYLARYLN
jgi:hypothetical protein